jgi:hypothetical protein
MTQRPPTRLAVAVGMLLALGLLAGSAVADEQVVGRPGITVVVPDATLEPGTETTIDVYLANEGQLFRSGLSDYVERVKTARATRLSVDRGDAPLTVETSVYPVGEVPPGTTGPIPIEVTIPEDATPGEYELPVRLSYVYTSIVTYDASGSTVTDVEFADAKVNRRATLDVEIESQSRFDLTTVGVAVQTGGSGNVTLELTNTGTEPASDAELTLTSADSSLTFAGGASTATVHVDRLAPDASRRFTVDVTAADNTATRPVALAGTVAYEDPDGVARDSQSLRTGIALRPEQDLALTMNGTARVGRERTITARVTNRGPDTVRDPTLTFGAPDGALTLGTTEYALPRLAPGESASVEVEVSVGDDAAQGPRPLSGQVEYRNDAGNRVASDDLHGQFAVGPHRDVFAVEAVNASVPAGQGGTVTLRITNQEPEQLGAIEAKAFATDPLSLTDDTAFVPALDPGESAMITVGVGAPGSATRKSYPIGIDFQYETADGTTELSDTARVGVTIANAASREGPGLGGSLWLLVPVAVAVAIAVWLRRRR